MRSVKTKSDPLSRAEHPHRNANTERDLAYAVRLVHRVCCLAGSASLIDDLPREDEGLGLRLATTSHQKPRAARFTDANPELVTKAAKLMDLQVYEVTSAELAETAKKLPIGRLYANGRGFVPNVRQSLYSKALVALAGDAQSKATDADSLQIATGLPRTWDEVTPGHLVIAQESHENGWWESIVVERKGDMLTLRFRDYPNLPKFTRHCTAIALMSPPAQ